MASLGFCVEQATSTEGPQTFSDAVEAQLALIPRPALQGPSCTLRPLLLGCDWAFVYLPPGVRSRIGVRGVSTQYSFKELVKQYEAGHKFGFSFLSELS